MSEPLTRETIQQGLDLVRHFEDRKRRAAERLALAPAGRWCFGLLGVATETPEYRFDTVAILRRVTEPPGEIELATALKEKHLFSAVGRYSHAIAHELVIEQPSGSPDPALFTVAWWLISAIRVRTLADFLVPAVADYSWSTIAGAPDSSCHVQLLEDVPRARSFAKGVTITSADLDWVSEHCLGFSRLLQVPQFRLAVECLTTHPMESSVRMSAASLWAGFEALLGVTAELRFRISALLATYLRPPGAERLSLFRRLKKLYDVRSMIVHGAPVKDKAVVAHIQEVRGVLSELLCRITEGGRCPTGDEWEEALFS
jgi:hypothetical protein